MKITLSFLGAASNVTGSRYLLDANGTRVLVDCGLYQERHLRDRNWAPFVVAPESIDAIVLTHAHLDHCGLLPKLVREGFRGRIYCSPATAEIARYILLDAAHIQQEDAEYKRRRHEAEGRSGPHADVPLYTVEDAERCLQHFDPVDYDAPIPVGEHVAATFREAGHVFGSTNVTLSVQKDGQQRRVLFSGDVGRPGMPILRDPKPADGDADYVLVESTYGNRTHETPEDIGDRLADVINRTHAAGGNVCIPSFALERAQHLLYALNELLLADRIPHLATFLDSPMAIHITEVFRNHPELFDREMTRLVNANHSPFDLPTLHMTRTVSQSKAINHIKGTVVVIAGSGMCTGGRIKHHLVHNIERPDSTVLFVGYQARGTLGRHILDGAEKVRILGRQWDVRAQIERIHGFSAHADRDELLEWLNGLSRPPRHAFVVHGEPESAADFREHLVERTGWSASVPEYRDTVTLD
ncbi:MAG: MBL fold metallo-hydrolase [Phycisphaerae bacterium]|nr:MBL fold metallo-hydrolase [Phycisphaerae bacterium]